MADPAPTDIRLSEDTLTDLMRRIWTAAGLPPEAAAIEAEVLVWANLRGVDSHGVQRVTEYLAAVEGGRMNPTPTIRVVKESPALALIDADLAFGPVVTVQAMDLAIEKAKTVGIGWVELRNNTHQGALGYYVEKAAREGLVGLAVVCSPANMAPTGSREKGVHNSPLAIGVPGGAHGPLVLDMATSVAAGGKLSVAKDKGVSIPESWALDENGDPTTDPHKAVILRPAGDYKGYGMALMFECLTSVMVGNPLLATKIQSLPGVARGLQNSFVAAIDVSFFGELDTYKANIDKTIAGLKELRRQDGVDEILVPGEPERKVLADRSVNGIPLPPGTAKKLRDAALKFGINLPEGL
jgi:LDH2 family malate/lactate/ureidoglycolate dehydrogenase